MKTIALIDYLWRGHHLTYYRIFVEVLRDLGYQVICICPQDKPPTCLWTENLPYIRPYYILPKWSSGVFPMPWSIRKYLVNFVRFYWAGRALATVRKRENTEIDFAFFNTIYDASFLPLHFIERIIPCQWSGVAINYRSLRLGTLNGLITPKIRDSFYGFRSSNCTAVCVLDETIAPQLQSHLAGKPVLGFPDVTDTTIASSHITGIDALRLQIANRHVVACLGSLDKRKGMLRLLDVAMRMRNQPVVFLFAGEFDDFSYTEDERRKLFKVISNPPSNCLFHLQYIEDGSYFNSLVTLSSVLFVAYEDFTNNSNLLTKAAFFGIPVITHYEHRLGECVTTYDLGITVANGDIDGYVTAIQAILATGWCGGQRSSSSQAYYQQHSVERLRATFSHLLNGDPRT